MPIVLAIVLFTALLPLIVLLASTEAVSAMLPTSRSIGQGEDPIDVEDIPPEMLRLYVAAARTCPGLHWSVPAAVGKIESDHGRSDLPGVKSGTNSAGAAGPMQFLISTWGGAAKIKAGTLLNGYAADGDDDGWADVYNPADAIYGAVKYLCASGAPADVRQALHAYNHSWAYVEDVLAQAERYRQVAMTKPQARQAFARAAGQRGHAHPAHPPHPGPDQAAVRRPIRHRLLQSDRRRRRASPRPRLRLHAVDPRPDALPRRVGPRRRDCRMGASQRRHLGRPVRHLATENLELRHGRQGLAAYERPRLHQREPFQSRTHQHALEVFLQGSMR
ncbi:lytic transglycosylase domain-containing protein [Nonomuraea dietziae]|uniref:lytic transglycosylase domain-containing protein n=1 Tax=Nonomuraea dietziae TaxID=65515 RepID=UPI00360E8CC8